MRNHHGWLRGAVAGVGAVVVMLAAGAPAASAYSQNEAEQEETTTSTTGALNGVVANTPTADDYTANERQIQGSWG